MSVSLKPNYSPQSRKDRKEEKTMSNLLTVMLFANYSKLNDDDVQKQLADKLWKNILSVINGIGNLALSTASNNSSDSNGLPEKHVDTYEKTGLVKTFKQVSSWVNPEQFANQINLRSKDIINFISEKVVNRNDIWE